MKEWGVGADSPGTKAFFATISSCMTFEGGLYGSTFILSLFLASDKASLDWALAKLYFGIITILITLGWYPLILLDT